MAVNDKQIKLKGIDKVMEDQTVTDIVSDLCARLGQGAVADEIGMDPAQFSRFKNGEGNISLAKIEALLKLADCVVVKKMDLYRQWSAFFMVTDTLKKTIQW